MPELITPLLIVFVLLQETHIQLHLRMCNISIDRTLLIALFVNLALDVHSLLSHRVRFIKSSV